MSIASYSEGVLYGVRGRCYTFASADEPLPVLPDGWRWFEFDGQAKYRFSRPGGFVYRADAYESQDKGAGVGRSSA